MIMSMANIQNWLTDGSYGPKCVRYSTGHPQIKNSFKVRQTSREYSILRAQPNIRISDQVSYGYSLFIKTHFL